VLERLATGVVRRRWVVLAAALVGMVLAGVIGGGVAALLTSGGFGNPDAEAARAAAVLEAEFGAAPPNLTLLVTAKQGGVDDPAVAALGQDLSRRLEAEPEVDDVTSYWTLGAPSLRSQDSTRAVIMATITGSDEERAAAAERLGERYRADTPQATVAFGGQAEMFREITETIEGDLVRAESVAIPLTVLLLIVALGSVVAGVIPVAIGGFAILGAFGVLRGLVELTDVSVFALNLITMLGLGLAIDYSLLIVFRYREELARGLDHPRAVVATVRTAGRTVLFSAGIVAASLAVLSVFPTVFLRSFAYAGVAVVAVATVGALVVLPALLAVLGPRFEAIRVRRVRPANGSGAWHRIATTVMRRPVLVALPVIVVLLLLGSPFLRVQFGQPDDRALPASASSRQVAEVLREEFTSREADALSVVATGVDGPAGRAGEIDAYAARLSELPGVAHVEAVTGSYADGTRVAGPGPAAATMATEDATRLSVVPTVEPYSDAGRALVADVRELHAPFTVLVGGSAASLVDGLDGIADRLPLALGLIAAVTLVLVFLLTGSVLIPVKALVMNLLSLTATYGALVWVFQDGNLSGLLDFTATGWIDTNMPILLFCIAFGLSMDYEVFLLSRIKEEHLRTGDTTAAVATGLQRVGRLTTTAAALVSIVFLALVTSQISFGKLFGLGAALAVIVDATLIRALLVPAFMRLLGQANWWAPRPLRWVYHRVGLRETAPQPGGAG
jgi:putative drug exporter of the RND superfamily